MTIPVRRRSAQKQRRSPAERVDSRHPPIDYDINLVDKRQNNDDDDGGFVLTGPITLTRTFGLGPTSRPAPSLTSITSRSTTSSLSTSVPRTIITTSSSPTRAAPTPSVSVNNTPNNNNSNQGGKQPNPAGALGRRGGIAPGAVAGIVIGLLVLLAVIAVVVARRLNAKKRQDKTKRMTWAKPGQGPVSSNDFVQGNYTDGMYTPRGAFGSEKVRSPGNTTPSMPMIRKETVTSPAGYGFSNNGLSSPPMATSGLYRQDTATSGLVAPPAAFNPAASAPTSPVGFPSRPASGYSALSGAGGLTSLPPFLNPFTVKSTFIPTLPDELSISTGEIVRVLAEYDDGWGLCQNVLGEKGMVPLACLQQGVVAMPGLNGIAVGVMAPPSSTLAPPPSPFADPTKAGRRSSSLRGFPMGGPN